jgi:sarcosine oxidase delta subunit
VTHAIGRERNCTEANISQQLGFVTLFYCTYCGDFPNEIDMDADGWTQRKQIKEWAESKGLTQYRIIRNTSYQQDMHGAVYELWVHPDDPKFNDARW